MSKDQHWRKKLTEPQRHGDPMEPTNISVAEFQKVRHKRERGAKTLFE
jgi:hypothetical protein